MQIKYVICRIAQIFQKYWHCHEILGTKRVTRGKFLIENLQIWSINHTVICRPFFGVCELNTHFFFVCKVRNISHCAENIRYHHVKSSHPCNQVAGIFVLCV